MRFAALALALVAVPLAGCATGPHATASGPQAAAYNPDADAQADVAAALERAKVSGKNVLLAMGANWCHDSLALAGWLGTPRFQQLVADHYELVFVDVGVPQTGNGRNLDIASRYGVEVKNTPNVLILSPQGELLNRDTATGWNNAASRSEDEIFADLSA